MGEETDPARLLGAAISAQEQLRGSVDDAVIDAALEALQAQLGLVSPDALVERERRLVTVLFLDVVDSTRLLVDVDPEETMTIMDGALQVLAEPIRARGGRVTRFMGDGFLAVFGLQRTREDDAEMAVRAGLDIIDLAGRAGGAAAVEHGIAGLDVRIGINTGLVVTGGINTVMGSAVNLASRIETSAEPGTVLVAQSTFRQLRGRFATEPAGTIEAKGFPDPVAVHVVLAEGSGVAARGAAPAFVGRGSEMEALGREFADAVSSAGVRAVTIVGNAGVGKSRLVDEFTASLGDGHVVSVFRAGATESRSTVPHALLRSLLDGQFGDRTDAPRTRDELAVELEPYLSDDGARQAKVELVARLLGYGHTVDDVPENPDRLRSRAAVHLAEFFRNRAELRPIVFALDDVHWADDGSLAVIVDVAAQLGATPVLVVGAMRPEPRDPEKMWVGLQARRVMTLGPLADTALAELLDKLLARIEDCPAVLRERLLEHAGGNPYYLEELVLMCIDEGIIVVGDDAWSVRLDRFTALSVPTTLAGVLRARLEGLEPSERSLLQQAAILGSAFWDDAAAHIADRSLEAIAGPLLSLQRRNMIELRTPSVFPESAEYGFSHVLLRDTAYDEVLLEDRRRHHSSAADWLMAASAGRTPEFAGQIGDHLERAGRIDEAAGFLAVAAEAAWKSYAIATADEFYRRALELVSESDDRRFDLVLGRVRMLALLGDLAAQRRELDALERLATESGDEHRRAQAAIRRTFFGFHAADYTDALAAAERARLHASATVDIGLQSRAMSSIAWAYLYLQDWEAARAAGEEALAIATGAEDTRSTGTALNILGMAAISAGELSEARQRTTQALGIAREAHDLDGEITYLSNLGVALTTLGDYGGALDRFSEVLRRAEDSGDRFIEGTAAVNLAWVAAAMGRWDEARHMATRGLGLKRSQGQREAEAEALLWLGHALVGLGDLDEAEAAYRGSGAIRVGLEQIALGLEADAGLVRVDLARGDVQQAAQRAEGLLGHLDGGAGLEGAWEPLRIHLAVIEACIAAGDERVDALLAGAVGALSTRAWKISDPSDRDRYLEAVPWHRRVLELAAANRSRDG